MCGIISIRVCALLFIYYVRSLQFDCISCKLGLSCCPIIRGCVRRCFRSVVSPLLLLRVIYLITCRAVLFNRVRLYCVIDFTGLPVYWFTGIINLSVLLC